MLTTSVPPGDKTSLFVMQALPLPPQVSNEEHSNLNKLTNILFGLHKLGLHKNFSFLAAAIISKLFFFFFLNFLLPKIVAVIA